MSQLPNDKQERIVSASQYEMVKILKKDIGISEETRQKYRNKKSSNKGKTYEEIYGWEESERIKNLKRGNPGPRRGEVNSEESKIKVSATLMGHEVSEETKQKIREKRALQEPLSEESWNKLKQSLLEYHSTRTIEEKTQRANKARIKLGFGVLQFTLSGDLVKEYLSLFEADKNSGVGYWKINRCAKGIVEEAGGYKWVFKKNIK